MTEHRPPASLDPGPRTTEPPTIAVLARIGGPTARPVLEASERLGRLLATKGFTIAVSGYGELVGAVGRGAALAGGRVVGFPVRSWPLEPTPWLTELRWMPDSYAQCAALGACPAIVVVGPGPASLAEAAFAWQIGGRRARLIFVGSGWHHWLAGLWRWLVPRRSDLATLTVVDDPGAVLGELGTPAPPWAPTAAGGGRAAPGSAADPFAGPGR